GEKGPDRRIDIIDAMEVTEPVGDIELNGEIAVSALGKISFDDAPRSGCVRAALAFQIRIPRNGQQRLGAVNVIPIVCMADGRDEKGRQEKTRRNQQIPHDDPPSEVCTTGQTKLAASPPYADGRLASK